MIDGRAWKAATVDIGIVSMTATSSSSRDGSHWPAAVASAISSTATRSAIHSCSSESAVIDAAIEGRVDRDIVEARAEEPAIIAAIDACKPITDCRTVDIPDAVNTLRWYAEAADKVFGKTAATGADHVGLIVREPVGVVGGVLPWNFPLMTLAWKIGPALATGNSLVIKPAELASHTELKTIWVTLR